MNNYRFEHITDVALLDDSDIKQFCIDLPLMIKELKKLEDASGSFELKGIVPCITWKNDNEDTLTIKVTCDGEDIASIKKELN